MEEELEIKKIKEEIDEIDLEISKINELKRKQYDLYRKISDIRVQLYRKKNEFIYGVRVYADNKSYKIYSSFFLKNGRKPFYEQNFIETYISDEKNPNIKKIKKNKIKIY